MSRDLRHRLGRLGEQAAADHLERLGYSILERNHRTRFGELDVIACDGATLVFAEVKTRRTGGAPFDAMTAAKRRRVRQMAAAWLVQTQDRPRAETVRFDAIGVTVDPGGRLAGLEHLEGAF
ncbi:MAG: YraN family protein [Solirubrobacteraceae bacterium]